LRREVVEKRRLFKKMRTDGVLDYVKKFSMTMQKGGGERFLPNKKLLKAKGTGNQFKHLIGDQGEGTLGFIEGESIRGGEKSGDGPLGYQNGMVCVLRGAKELDCRGEVL